MKLSVAAPLVALFTAYILALLALLAGIKPNFMPDAYIVRIAEKYPETSTPGIPTSTSSGSSSTATSHTFTTSTATNSSATTATSHTFTTLTATNSSATTATSHTFTTLTATDPSATTAIGTGASNIPNASSSRHEAAPTPSTSSSTRPTSPAHSSVATDTPSKHEHGLGVGLGGQDRVEPVDNAQVFSRIINFMPSLVKMLSHNDHVSIHARSDPKNDTSNEDEEDEYDGPFKPYTMHFLTNCQWSLNDETESCTKPWNFLGYSLEADYFDEDEDDDDDSHKDVGLLLLMRNAADDSEPEDEDEKLARKLIHNREAFAKVHLTGCVFVGVSFLCTAVGFFILPALGKWISVGNLALATLATIFLVTSSTFTAVLAREVRNYHQKEDDFTAKPGQTLGALV